MIELQLFDALKDLVGNRCYPLTMPQPPLYPAIVYQRLATNAFNRLEGGASIDQVRVQIDCYAPTYEAVKALASGVRSALESASFKATLQTEFDLYEPDLEIFRIIQDFYLWQK